MNNNTLEVSIGEAVTVRKDENVTISCVQLVNDTGAQNLTINWYKDGISLTNGSETNVVISEDNQFCIITNTLPAVSGDSGTTGNYTCKVCNGSGDCINSTSPIAVCGEFQLEICSYFSYVYVGIPHLDPPISQPTRHNSLVSLTCGQDITLSSLATYLITITCGRFNGSEPSNLTVYRDAESVVGTTSPFLIQPPNGEFGTYTFVLSTEHCGSTSAVTRILEEG